jgi:hypothetical protein
MGCSVADIFVDDVSEHLQTSEQQGEGEDINEMNAYYTNPNGKKKNSTTKKKGKEKSQEDSAEDQSSDSDYMPGDNSSSEDDDEVSEINNWYKDVKKKMKTGQLEHLDDVLIDCSRVRTKDLVGDEDVSDNTSYAKNSEFDDSFDEVGSDDQIVMRPSRYRRFKETDGVPEFSLGMKFGSKQEFKEAMIQYGLATKKVIKFQKNDAIRCVSVCTWSTCPWYCRLASTTLTNSWQITTFNDLHTCPQRKDNKLVTSSRIAAKYGKLIRANPTWRIDSMQAHIQEEMFANISTSKIKRAKKIVMTKWLDAKKGQYAMVHDYQEELLRSNPGSTVVVTNVQQPGDEPPIFGMMYVCLDALKKGFMAGCRKVIGLDGCFFKGSTNGELLCAIGRDANNQMYLVAWAVVDKETNESWDWFVHLFFRDVNVGDGQGWIISDQQKVRIKIFVCLLSS